MRAARSAVGLAAGVRDEEAAGALDEQEVAARRQGVGAVGDGDEVDPAARRRRRQGRGRRQRERVHADVGQVRSGARRPARDGARRRVRDRTRSRPA